MRVFVDLNIDDNIINFDITSIVKSTFNIYRPSTFDEKELVNSLKFHKPLIKVMTRDAVLNDNLHALIWLKNNGLLQSVNVVVPAIFNKKKWAIDFCEQEKYDMSVINSDNLQCWAQGMSFPKELENLTIFGESIWNLKFLSYLACLSKDDDEQNEPNEWIHYTSGHSCSFCGGTKNTVEYNRLILYYTRCGCYGITRYLFCKDILSDILNFGEWWILVNHILQWDLHKEICDVIINLWLLSTIKNDTITLCQERQFDRSIKLNYLNIKPENLTIVKLKQLMTERKLTIPDGKVRKQVYIDIIRQDIELKSIEWDIKNYARRGRRG